MAQDARGDGADDGSVRRLGVRGARLPGRLLKHAANERKNLLTRAHPVLFFLRLFWRYHQLDLVRGSGCNALLPHHG